MKRRTGKSGPALSLLRQAPARIAGHLVGELVASDSPDLLVTFPNNPHGPLSARSTLDLPVGRGTTPVPVLLVFEQERSDRPIIVGVLRDSSASSDAAGAQVAHVALAPQEARSAEALVDGKRVVLSAEDEIVLRCGKASITLRRNGRVVIRGVYVETRAEGVNRVKGGSVQIN
jgi:hypothetical protein